MKVGGSDVRFQGDAHKLWYWTNGRIERTPQTKGGRW